MTRIPRKSCLHPYAERWGQVLSMNNGSVCSQALILPEHSHFGPLAHFSCFLFLSLGSSETQQLLPMLDFSQGLLICTLYNHCPKLGPCHIKNDYLETEVKQMNLSVFYPVEVSTYSFCAQKRKPKTPMCWAGQLAQWVKAFVLQVWGPEFEFPAPC